MALRDEIVPFIDGEGFVSPSLVTPGCLRASDNGTMYSSEYYIMLSKLGQLVSQDKADYLAKINSCIDQNGLLNRHPGGSTQEGPDDYYGVLNGCKTLGNTEIPRKFLKAVVKYCGFLNNENPGKWTLSSFLIRQPQLVACMISAAFPSLMNPLHIMIRMLFMPFFVAAAIGLLISGIGTPIDSADPRRLGWHVWQCLEPVSIACWLAGKVWRNRLYSTYPNGMRDVAKIYYQSGHPFAKYWITD